jgi:hypothetical protein
MHNANRLKLQAFVQEVVSNRASLLCMDADPGYAQLKRRFPHQSVGHTIGQHFVGAVHTNTIEGFWYILKRGVVGTYHDVSKKYLRLQVSECYNRLNADIFDEAIKRC